MAAEWAGFRTICFVEIDPYCQKILAKHWPDTPIIGDIRNVTEETITHAYQESQPVSSINGESGCWQLGQGRKTTNNKPPVTLITGGFPCQPVSQAGKRKGKDDDRWLWPEMLRVISGIRPDWCVAENVAGLLNMGFNDCVSDLESEGYETIPFLIPACAVNAPHRRDRIFIVGYAKHTGWDGTKDGTRFVERNEFGIREEGEKQTRKSEGPGDVADTTSNRSKARISGQEQGKERETGEPFNSRDVDTNADQQRWERQGRGNGLYQGCQEEEIGRGDWWSTEPQLGRVAYGIPRRVDRLRCLGNAVVPQQIYPILKAIADIEYAQLP